MQRPALFALLAVAASSPALALETYMWGIGPRVGTHVLPGKYPILMPKERGGDGTTGPRGDDGIARVQHDLTLGGKGVYYMDRHHRIGFDGGAMFGIAMGPGRRSSTWDLVLTYDYAIEGKALDILFGGGIGAGTTGFRGPDDQRLRLNTFPMRGQITALARDNSRGYELTVFAQYNTPSSSTYTTAAGDQPRITGGFWITSGLQISVLFGDFSPPTGAPSPVRRLPPE
jgi:hypothetical protein